MPIKLKMTIVSWRMQTQGNFIVFVRKIRYINVKHFILRRSFIWRNRIDPAPRTKALFIPLSIGIRVSGLGFGISCAVDLGPGTLWTSKFVGINGIVGWDSAGAGMSHCHTRVTRISLFAFAVRVPKTETIQSVDLRMMGTFPSVQPSTNINLRSTSSLV